MLKDGLSDEGARKDLSELVSKGILLRQGKGRSARYVIYPIQILELAISWQLVGDFGVLAEAQPM